MLRSNIKVGFPNMRFFCKYTEGLLNMRFFVHMLRTNTKVCFPNLRIFLHVLRTNIKVGFSECETFVHMLRTNIKVGLPNVRFFDTLGPGRPSAGRA